MVARFALEMLRRIAVLHSFPVFFLPALALVAPAAAGTTTQEDPLLEWHLRNVWMERRAAFEHAWDAADAERRARVRAVFEERKRGGVPAIHQASAQLLTELRSVLEGDVDHPRELSVLTQLAQSLDLRILPGAFSATRVERGDEIIVRVLPVYTRLLRAALPELVELTLVWSSPDGRDIRARSEPVHRDAFALPGFEMYFHAPPSEPGTWSLTPLVELDGETGRGVGVAVECIANLFPRYDRLASTPTRSDLDAHWRLALEDHLVRGVRDATTPSIEALLEEELDGLVGPPIPGEWGGAATHVISPAGEGDPRGTVLVVAPALEDASWSLAGRRGEAWRELVERSRSTLYVTSLPVSDPAGPDVLGILDRLHSDEGRRPITVVVSGSTFGRLRIALMPRGDELPFERLVMDSALLSDGPPRRFLPVPTLAFQPLAEDAALREVETSGGPSLHWARRAAPPVLAANELPRQIADWLATLD